MTALRKLAYLMEHDYLAFELNANMRHEYIDGQTYAMAGASERHNRIAGNIFFHLRSATRGGPCAAFISDMKLRIALHSAYYYPDVMLTCNAHDNNEYYKQQPSFIAEVLSPHTANLDRREKLFVYQKIPSLRYYLLVSTEQLRVEYFVRDDQNEWKTALLEADETLEINLENYRAVLTLRDIYEDVEVLF
ncbi:Uma2 domain-containing protein [Gammaproteobacteria bacterium]